MKQIRLGVFETNSSSTHSLMIATKKEYIKWKEGELLISRWNEKPLFIPNDGQEHEEYMSENDFWDIIQQETFITEFETPSGDKMVAFGYYGYDG